MVSREALLEQFSNMGASLTDAVITKCVEICVAYAIDEEELAETWTAYSCSKCLDIDPTPETLSQMERAEFGKKKKTPSKPQQSLVVYNPETVQDDDFGDEILNTYSTTPKAKSRPPQHVKTPDRIPSGRTNILTPASFSPLVSTPSTRYASRSNAGKIVCSIGDIEKTNWSAGAFEPTVKTLQSVPHNALYMFDTLRDRAALLESNLENVAEKILFKAGINNPVEISAFHSDKFETYGRICAMGDELTFDNVMLESFDDKDGSCITPIHVKAVPRMSVFPGQVVALRATKVPPNVYVSEIFSDAALPIPDNFLEFANEGPLQIVIASGPYTLKDTMTYQPLADLMEYVTKHRPHIVILIGPFIDADHDHVKDSLLAETFEDFFEKQINFIMKSLEGLQTKVVLVASLREAHHHPVFPTPAYEVHRTHPNVILVGDPCIVSVDGLTIGATSVDVLHHISRVELFDHSNSQDRMGRISKHIILQQNFYPLYPPSEHINLDMKLWHEYCQLPFTPHVLILPSDLRGFVKVECGSVLINPEHLSKGYVGGTFAHLEVKSSSGKWNPASTTCKVVKI